MQKRDGGITFSVKNFLSQYRKISLGNTSVYQKISGVEKFYASERGGEYHVFPSKIFCHTVPKNFVGTLRCIRKFRVSKNFMHQRGGVSRSPSKTFCHTVPKNFVGTLRCIRKFRLSKNFMHQREGWGGGYHVLRRKLFVSQ